MGKKTLICVDCGAEFIGEKAYYCPTCRKKHNASPQKMQKLHDGYFAAKEREKERIEKKLALLAKQRQKEPLEVYTPCPNFDVTSTVCASCPPEAWKFKNCGRKL